MIHGTFELITPPPGGEQWFREVLALCDYPFWRCLPYVRDDKQQTIYVRWTNDIGANLGRWLGTGELKLNVTKWATRPRSEFTFTLVHEMGHMVKTAVLQRYGHLAPILAAMHVDRWGTDPCVPGGNPLIWDSDGTIWHEQHDEALADLFVAAFAPTVWAGQQRRTWHWNNDIELIRRILLEATVTTPYVDIAGESDEAKSAIEWAYATGIMQGTSPTTFSGGQTLTRRQIVQIVKRLYDFDKSENGT